ncbi:MAG: hypothetical protein Q7J54_03645 [Candidatus Woesearchaeota archaeon]|nr:hypothetical protein [Candidatus Woesearchaeota archaeon]
MDVKKPYDPKLIADNIRPLYETIRRYNIKVLQKNPDLAKEAGTVFHRLKELIKQYQNLPQHHKTPKMDGLFKRYDADYTNIEKKLSRFVQYPQEEIKSTQSAKGIERKIEIVPKPLPKISVPDYILNGINEDAAKRDPLPLCYILGIESGGGCTADSFSAVSEAIDHYNKIDTSKGITMVILKTEKKDEKINSYPVSLEELKNIALPKISAAEEAETKTETGLSIDQLIQAEIDKRGDKKPFYKFKLFENQIKELTPVEDPVNLTKMILPPGDHIAYDPVGKGKYAQSNMKFDIDAAVKKYSEKINPPQTLQQDIKKEVKLKETLNKPFGTSIKISEEDLKATMKSVKQASQERISEDKAARDNPLNADRQK